MFTSQYLDVIRGDSAELPIQMALAGEPFFPGAGYTLIWTLKRRASDPDSAAIVQKMSGGLGITVEESIAKVALVSVDTAAREVDRPYAWDLQAQETATGKVHTVAIGKLTLEADITRGTTISIPVYTTEPAALLAGGVIGRPLPTGYTGGGATDIHSLATTGLPAGTIILTPNMPPGERQWQVIADPAAEDIASGLVRQTDYHATTNRKGLQLF
jgi:hypothetical protein